ncbi:MAG: hypothetical protein H6719_38335 [Sandaracinaceae bacterium]|nr:hypothetical protein [Sandaracinaceae bacterium]
MRGGPGVDQYEEILDDGTGDEPDADPVQEQVFGGGIDTMERLGDDDLEVALAREVGGELVATFEGARDPQVQQ